MPRYNVNDGLNDYYGGKLGDRNSLAVLVELLTRMHAKSDTFAELVLRITVVEDDEKEPEQCH